MKRHRLKRSFTLLEVIAALVLLSTAIPTMLWSLAESHRQRTDPVLMMTAAWLAQERLEDVLADAYSTERGFSWIQNSRYPRERQVSEFTQYDRRVLIRQRDINLNSAGSDCKLITVEVRFRTVNQRVRTLRVSAVVVNPVP